MFNSGIFKAYDIRGSYPSELNERVVWAVARALAQYLKPSQLVVGQDARISSERLKPELLHGLLAAGVNILDIGQCTTPQFYFAVNYFKADGGVMLTASHNPIPDNGLKLVGPGAVALGQDSGLSEIKTLCAQIVSQNNAAVPSAKLGLVKRVNVIGAYLDFLAQNLNLGLKRPIIVDAGNGMTGLLLPSLLRQVRLEYLPLNFEPDFEQPNRGLDPAVPGVLLELCGQVVSRHALLGAAFDGDGDRLVLINERGQLLRPEQVLYLLAQLEPPVQRGRVIVHGLNMSRALGGKLHNLGFEVFKSRVGHALIKKAMLEKRALLGAELSGHFYFNFKIHEQDCFFESGLAALIRILRLINQRKQNLSQLLANFQLPAYSGELNFKVQNNNVLMTKIKTAFAANLSSELDGISVEFADWWFNLRPSNTQALVRLVVEAQTEQLLAEKLTQLQQLIAEP